jgi:hypothetical protein
MFVPLVASSAASPSSDGNGTGSDADERRSVRRLKHPPDRRLQQPAERPAETNDSLACLFVGQMTE